LAQRISRLRKRFIQLWVRSTTRASRLLAGRVGLGFRGFAAGANVGDKVEGRGQPAQFLKVVALVQAEVLRLSGRRHGPLDGAAQQGLNEHLEVVFVRAGDA